MDTWKPIAAGLFNLLAGVLSLIEGFVLALLALGAAGFMVFVGIQEATWAGPIVFGIGVVFFAFLSLCCFVLAAIALRGGMAAVQRESWGWALAGSIATLISLFPLGILAVVFTVMAEDELRDAPA